ncbi:hypothetical protein [Acinetobacter phage vB_AbaM_IME512]|uniref:Terminase small subunit n=1 Tax=Acinetobacter phage P919 TaxID=3229763 RepID=A0AB39AIL6_9CAUD|nr:hypothetical protein [Acinetobacter phage vB_AbaM_IME512]
MSNEVGRPTKYKEEYNEQAYKLCLLGHTDEELAQFFEVDVSTIHRWKHDHPDFCDSIKKGKEIADGNVVASLYHRAIGYQAPDIDIKMYEGEIIETPYIKHYPPDATSAIFWLKNRQPKKWRDKQVTEHEGQITIETKSMEDIFK